MDDVIYRKDVLELFEDINNMLNQTLEDFTLTYPTTKICEFCRDVINDLTDDVKELPSAEPKKGKWIDETFKPNGLARYPYRCNQCGCRNDYTSMYCPDCGAKMEGEENV